MPTYDYICNSCGHEFEVRQKMSDPAIKTCEKCGEEEVTKLISSGNFVLKGSGWYADGYSSNKGRSDSSCASKSASCGSCDAA